MIINRCNFMYLPGMSLAAGNSETARSFLTGQSVPDLIHALTCKERCAWICRHKRKSLQRKQPMLDFCIKHMNPCKGITDPRVFALCTTAPPSRLLRPFACAGPGSCKSHVEPLSVPRAAALDAKPYERLMPRQGQAGVNRGKRLVIRL